MVKPNTRLTTAWLVLSASVKSSANATEALCCVQTWLQQTPALSQHAEAVVYGLKFLEELPLAEYPLATDPIALHDAVEAFTSATPHRVSSMADRIRNLFWALASVHSEILCQRCEQDYLIFATRINPPHEVLLTCDQCGFLCTTSGGTTVTSRTTLSKRADLTRAELKQDRH